MLTSLSVLTIFQLDYWKDAADYIASPLSYIFNMSLSKGVFPDAIKIAKVTPVYKKGEKDIPGNYRPISVLPLLAKVLEENNNSRQITYFMMNSMISKEL